MSLTEGVYAEDVIQGQLSQLYAHIQGQNVQSGSFSVFMLPPTPRIVKFGTLVKISRIQAAPLCARLCKWTLQAWI